MKKVELLAPAGDQESLIAAIQNGADALYLGGTLFNARAYAKNFDNEQLKWAVEYAHLRNVRIFVTVNTLFKDDEFDELLKYIDYLYHIQIDALIIQDIGLFSIVRKYYPDFEIHMSTQASVMNSQGVAFFEEQGAKRVVLARENTIDEIKKICASTSLDIEVFVHGALCVGYSGQCLMSSFIGKRSGNRGQCAQPCRLNYKLKKDDQILSNDIPYLLSLKDLMTIEHVGELIDAGVHSFKIEGRMKRPEYVASVVRAYRKAIDAHLNKKKVNLADDIHYMKSMFNRDYTSGYIFNDNQILKGDYPGNKGIVIGKVNKYFKNKKRVLMTLSDDLKQGDSIVFEDIDKGRPVNKIYLNNKLVNAGKKGDIVELEFDYPVYQGNVRKTINSDIIEMLQKTYDKDYRKEPIDLYFEAFVSKPALLKVSARGKTVTKTSDEIVQIALNTPLDEERIKAQISKLGQSTFYANRIKVRIDDNMTLPIKVLNQLRRDAIEELSRQLSEDEIHNSITNNIKFDYQKVIADNYKTHIYVSNIKQLECVLDYPLDYIYYPYCDDSLTAYQLCKTHHKDMILVIPRINKDTELQQLINSDIYKLVDKVVVNEYGSYSLCKDKDKIIGTGLNVYNQHSANFYKEKKILSLEMSLTEINSLNVNFNDVIVQVYGKIENMISEYCPISQHYFSKQNKKCNICKTGQFSLIDRKNESFDLLMDDNCRMHLLNSKALYFDQPTKLKSKGLLLHFTNESTKEVKEIIEDYYNCLYDKKRHIQKDNKNWTFGYFKS